MRIPRLAAFSKVILTTISTGPLVALLIRQLGRELLVQWQHLPTAGFDPIFSIHHSNIDRLWAEWSCMPGKKWGTLPSDYWFNQRPWFFFDTDGKVIE